jgi:hypothetical protein
VKTLANASDTNEILRRLKKVRPDSPRRWGRMTSHQMICHLIDSFRMMAAERDVSDATGPVQQTIVKWFALYLPLPWPAGIMTRPEIDQELGGSPPVEFAADIDELVRRVERVAAAGSSIRGAAHPIFGPMSSADWLRWSYRHLDHHLRQFGA